MNMSSDLRWHQ